MSGKDKGNKRVNIQLDAKQLPIILGAIFIGRHYQDWHSILANPKFEYKKDGTLVCLHEKSKNKWFDKITEIDKEIKKQTGIYTLDIGPQIDRYVAEKIQEFFKYLYEAQCIKESKYNSSRGIEKDDIN